MLDKDVGSYSRRLAPHAEYLITVDIGGFCWSLFKLQVQVQVAEVRQKPAFPI
jgi:hypothetical protein